MKRFQIFTLSLLLPFCLCSCVEILELDRHMSEEQKEEYEEFNKMARVVVKNETSLKLYLVIDYMDFGNIPPGRRAGVSVEKGAHTLEAYDQEGQLAYRVTIYLFESDSYLWEIGGS